MNFEEAGVLVIKRIEISLSFRSVTDIAFQERAHVVGLIPIIFFSKHRKFTYRLLL